MDSPGQPDCWWGAECNLISSQLQTSYPIPGMKVVARRRVGQFGILELRARHPVLLTRGEVARALTTTELSHDQLMAQTSS